MSTASESTVSIELWNIHDSINEIDEEHLFVTKEEEEGHPPYQLPNPM